MFGPIIEWRSSDLDRLRMREGTLAMRVAYLVNTYPRPSLTFIRREIQAVEGQGIEVWRFALRGERTSLVDAGDLAEHDRTEHVLDRGASRIVAATLAEIARSPRRGAAALGLALAAGGRSPRGLLRHLAYFAEACYLARRFRALGIEHLHAHFGTNSATVAMLVGALGGPRWSFTVHGPEEFDGPLALGLPEKMRRAAFTVAVSSFGRSQLCRWVAHTDWPRIRVVHCGIEPGLFAEPQPLPDGPVRLVAIGRLVEQKGQLLLIEALAQAVGSHPTLRLTLVGDGELRGPIEAAVRDHRLEDHVTITGWVDEGRVRAELAAAHALVMPSFAEGLPMVIMEAMAAGRPVVATFVAGTPELVVAGETGWLVPAGDPDALAAALSAVAATPRDRLAALGRAGRARALLRHDVHVEAAKLVEHFRRRSPPDRIEEAPSATRRKQANPWVGIEGGGPSPLGRGTQQSDLNAKPKNIA